MVQNQIRIPCPECKKQRKGNGGRVRLFSPKGLKVHITRKHNGHTKPGLTNMQVDVEVIKTLEVMAKTGESLNDTIRRLLGLTRRYDIE